MNIKKKLFLALLSLIITALLYSCNKDTHVIDGYIVCAPQTSQIKFPYNFKYSIGKKTYSRTVTSMNDMETHISFDVNKGSKTVIKLEVPDQTYRTQVYLWEGSSQSTSFKNWYYSIIGNESITFIY